MKKLLILLALAVATCAAQTSTEINPGRIGWALNPHTNVQAGTAAVGYTGGDTTIPAQVNCGSSTLNTNPCMQITIPATGQMKGLNVIGQGESSAFLELGRVESAYNAPGLSLGPGLSLARDTYLVRSGSNALYTPGAFTADGGIGTSTLTSTGAVLALGFKSLFSGVLLTTPPSCTSGIFYIYPITGSYNNWQMCSNGTLSTIGGGGGTWGSITGTLSSQTDLQNALNLKAPLASPALTGTPTAPTQTALDSSTKVSTTAYTDSAVGVETARATTAEAGKVATSTTVNGHALSSNVAVGYPDIAAGLIVNGTTAATQPVGDTSAKLATDALVAQSRSGAIQAVDYGVHADGVIINDATFGSGSSAVTCGNSDCIFTSGDVGKVMFGTSAGTDVSQINSTVILPEGTITAVTDANHITVSTTATVSTTGTIVYGHLDSAPTGTTATTANDPLLAAWTAATNACLPLQLPVGVMLTDQPEFDTYFTTTPCSDINSMYTNRAGYRLQGYGTTQTIVAITPGIDPTKCTGPNGSGSGCFLSVPSLWAKELTLYGAGNSSLPGFSGKHAVEVVGEGYGVNARYENVSFYGWGSLTSGFIGVNGTSGTGVSAIWFENVNLEAFGATEANIAIAGQVTFHNGQIDVCGTNCLVLSGGGTTFDGNQTQYGWSAAFSTGTVNTAGTAVTWASGTVFTGGTTALVPSEAITINNVGYIIQSVNSSTSLTLTTSAGTLTGTTFKAGGSDAVTVNGAIFNSSDDQWYDANTTGNGSQLTVLGGGIANLNNDQFAQTPAGMTALACSGGGTVVNVSNSQFTATTAGNSLNAVGLCSFRDNGGNSFPGGVSNNISGAGQFLSSSFTNNNQPAHRFWQVSVTATTGGGGLSIGYLGFYDSAGNLLSTGGYPTASTCYTESAPCNTGTYSAASAFIDTTGTHFWSANSNPSASVPQTITYQFTAPVAPATLILYQRALANQEPSNFTINYSDDGKNWTTAQSFASVPWASYLINPALSFAISTPATGSYTNWQFSIPSTQSGTALYGSQVQMRTTVGGSQSATGGAAFASSEFNTTQVPGNAFLTSASYWEAGSGVSTGTLGYAFLTPVNIAQVIYGTVNSGSYAGAPNAFTLQGSNDGGIHWTTVGTSYSPATWTTAAQTQTFSTSSTVAPTFTAGTNVTSCGCASGYTCTDARGELTIVGGTATTGTICTTKFATVPESYGYCEALDNSGAATTYSISHGTPSTTAFTISAGATVASSTVTVDYHCIP